MRLYFSSLIEGTYGMTEEQIDEIFTQNHILASFAYYKPNHDRLYEKPKSVMLDSGAFTVMSKSMTGKSLSTFNPMEYCKKYAEFIRRMHIDFFIELDIEAVYGFDVYKDCLHQLQDITGKDPIYVYHKWRGLKYYKMLVQKHKYIALGDVDNIGHNNAQEQFFPWFVEEAHKNGCRVHGLAFTRMDKLGSIPFDSVDSSTWTAAARFAEIPRFNGHHLNKYRFTRTDTMQIKNCVVSKLYSLSEWSKLARYFETEYEPIW